MEIKFLNKTKQKRGIIFPIALTMINFYNDICPCCKFYDYHLTYCQMCREQVRDVILDYKSEYYYHKLLLFSIFISILLTVSVIKSISYSIWLLINILFYINYIDYYYLYGEHELYFSLKLFISYKKDLNLIAVYIIYFSVLFICDKLYMLIVITSLGQILMIILVGFYGFLIPELFLLYVEFLSHNINKDKYIFHFVYGLIKIFLYNNYFLSFITKNYIK